MKKLMLLFTEKTRFIRNIAVRAEVLDAPTLVLESKISKMPTGTTKIRYVTDTAVREMVALEGFGVIADFLLSLGEARVLIPSIALRCLAPRIFIRMDPFITTMAMKGMT